MLGRRDCRDLSSIVLIFHLRLELLSIVPCEGTKSSRRIIYKKERFVRLSDLFALSYIETQGTRVIPAFSVKLIKKMLWSKILFISW